MPSTSSCCCLCQSQALACLHHQHVHSACSIKLRSKVAGYKGALPTDWSDSRAVYKVPVAPNWANDTDQATTLSADLLFQYTATYPETLPNLHISNTRGLTSAETAQLQRALRGVATQQAGLVCIFDVVQAAQEWLASKFGSSFGAFIPVSLLAAQFALLHAESHRRCLYESAPAHRVGVMCGQLFMTLRVMCRA